MGITKMRKKVIPNKCTAQYYIKKLIFIIYISLIIYPTKAILYESSFYGFMMSTIR